MAGLSCCTSVRDVVKPLLDRASIEWHGVFVGETPAVAAALVAGLAIAPFPMRLAPVGTVDVREAFGLPPLPYFSIILHSSPTDQKTKHTLREIAAAIGRAHVRTPVPNAHLVCRHLLEKNNRRHEYNPYQNISKERN